MVILGEFNLEALLHYGALVDLALHRDLDLYSPTMRFCPDEARVDDSEFV